MAKATPRQRRTEGRVMHEFKHGELKSGRGGAGGKVKSRKQAIAIGLSKARKKGKKVPKKKKPGRKEEAVHHGRYKVIASIPGGSSLLRDDAASLGMGRSGVFSSRALLARVYGPLPPRVFLLRSRWRHPSRPD
jgi:hypothetical protein